MRKKLLNAPEFLLGKFWELKVEATGIPMVFVDQDGFRFWQDSSDPILRNHQRRAVGDSTDVRKYILRRLHKGVVCIDIGACIGFISVPLWSVVGSTGKVISIEADPQNIEKLKSNLLLNGFSDQFAMNAAITNTDGIAELRRFHGINGWQTIGAPAFAEDYTFQTFTVAAFSLGSVLDKYGIGFVDFVKIDVEGAEPIVLNGMRQLLDDRVIGEVLFEVNHLMLEGTGHNVGDLIGFWSDFNYRLYRVGSGGERQELPDGKWPTGYIGDCVAIAEV